MVGQGLYTLTRNVTIARDVYEMTLLGNTDALEKPGQFVNILLEGYYLRRPISVCDWEKGRMTLLYKTVGRGTERMAGMAPGDTLDLLTGLGNGFDILPARGKKIALIGGGTGVPPLYALCKALGGNAACVLGFGSGADVFYEHEFRKTGARVTVTTADGSYGTRGFVTDALRDMDYNYYFACGPEPMLRAVHRTGRDGQLSFEARMGCGFGACMGCSCQTIAGSRRICVDGPVMLSREVLL
jgi:dihydroorotate dehydrogenase electron transfer subunit